MYILNKKKMNNLSIKDFYPTRPTGEIIRPDGSYVSNRTLGNTPYTCPECSGFAWTLHTWMPYSNVGVCSGCFRKVKNQGDLTKNIVKNEAVTV